MFKIWIALIGGLIEVSKCTKVVDNIKSIDSSHQRWREIKLKTAQSFIKYRDFVVDN